MNVGIVSQWRNQGQATLSRHLRDAVRALGHRTFVLARPTHGTHMVPGKIDRSDVWDQEDVEDASDHMIPATEYERWARRHDLDAVFCNQNYQFTELRALRAMGVKTIGYFVWESFRERDVRPARQAYDVIYSLNRCTQERYRRLGIESPYVRWGCHPELLNVAVRKRSGQVAYFFPGGMQGPRKPLQAVVTAFKQTRNPALRLVLKAQGTVERTEAVDIDDDPRIERIVADLKTTDYLELFASCHVCLAPSRYEGTGLHLYEAAAVGVPLITNDIPPMNEFVRNGYNGRLVVSHVVGEAKSGIPTYDPDVDDLTAAIEELSDPATIARMSENARAVRDQLRWETTVADLAQLLEGR